MKSFSFIQFIDCGIKIYNFAGMNKKDFYGKNERKNGCWLSHHIMTNFMAF